MSELLKKRKIASAQSLGLSDRVIYKNVINLLRKHNLQRGLLLDYGAGQGEFLKLLKNHSNFKLHGIDLMKSNIEGIKWLVHDLNQPICLESEKYDIITAIEVIEHLENPRQTVRDLYKILKPGGRIILTTPNNESWRSVISYIIRGHFVAFTESSYPAHITALNRVDIYRVLIEAGFKDIHFSYTNTGMVPSIPNLTWQKCSLGLLKGLRYSDNLLVTAIK